MGKSLDRSFPEQANLDVETGNFDEHRLLEFMGKIEYIRKYEVPFEEKERLVKGLDNYDDFLKEAIRQRQSPAPFTVLRSLIALSEVCDTKLESEDRYKNVVADYALSKMATLLPNMENQTDNPSVRLNEILEIYYRLSNGNSEQQRLGVKGLYNRLNKLSRYLYNPRQCWQGLEYLKKILSFGNPEQKAEATHELITATRAAEGQLHFPTLVSTFFGSAELEPYGLEILGSQLEKFGLPKAEIIEAWRASHEDGVFGGVVTLNLRTVDELEKKDPGVCKFLYENFGIADFGRYPSELLIAQKREFNSLKNPYGTIIFPKSDWNGSFYQDSLALKKFFEELDGQFSLRVFECSSKTDIARALITLNARYNPASGGGHKISLLILGGHGTKDRIEFGDQGDRHSLFTTDLFSPGVQRTNQFFEENPTIILSSCSTGVEGGIGQELSEKFGAKVIAPKIPTGLRALHGSKNRGQDKFRFNAQYSREGEDIKSLYKMGKTDSRT